MYQKEKKSNKNIKWQDLCKKETKKLYTFVILKLKKENIKERISG